MKTLALYTILLGAGAMTLYSHLTSDRQSFYAPLETVELEMTEELFNTDLVRMHTVSAPMDARRSKEYHIYYENRSSEAIDVAIRYKTYGGEWETRGFETLAPGEKKLMGLSDQKTYYSYAQGTKKLRRKKWRGKHNFSLEPNSSNKIQFEKQEIWECYDTQMCNTFAVFR